MSGKRYPEEFKIEAVKQVVILFPAWRNVSVSPPTVFMPG
ncbi:hypothetical protein BN128_947 [Cronobacter sakazakii 696]|nr:hypothetical protein BN128_947 [Cronobacter sakazakii 696]